MEDRGKSDFGKPVRSNSIYIGLEVLPEKNTIKKR